MRSRVLQVLIVLSLIVFAFSVAQAQDVASVTGTVTDPTGAVIPGSSVELSNPSRGLSFKQSTDTLGVYRFASVPTGNGFKITVSHEGFAVREISDITLSVGITRT